MIRRIFTVAIFGGAAVLGSSEAAAVTFGVEYATEWQTDFSGAYDWLNLLKGSAQVPLGRALKFEASAISTCHTYGEDAIVADLLAYSNIAAPDIPLTFARLGFGLTIKNAELFAGINNVNEDYFTSPLTSFFTNSSCGISPTISCNYDIANYPLASWCLHYRQQAGPVAVQTSLYPGRGYSRIFGHDNLFKLDLRRHGFFSISSIDYGKNGIYCVLGIALHYGVCMGDDAGQLRTPTPQKRFSAAPWVLSEIELPHSLGLLVHASCSSVAAGCRAYGALGLTYSGAKVQPGIALNYAHFTEASEYTAELSCRIPLLDGNAEIQPALHLIGSSQNPLKCVGLLRFCYNL